MTLSDDQITEIFFSIDEFYRDFESATRAHLIGNAPKRKPRLSQSEIMTILICFHLGQFRNMKSFYLGYVCTHLTHLFPKLVSYNRFVELTSSVALPLSVYLKTRCLGNGTGISFIDSTSIRVCKDKRIKRNRVFKDTAELGKTTMGFFYGFKLHLIINDKGEIINFMITKGNVDDREPLKCENFVNELKGKLFGDKGYISKALGELLFSNGLHLITNIKSNMKNSLMSLKDKILLRKRSIIETVNDELKNICQIEHSRHRSFTNFIVNLISGLTAYCFLPKKPGIKFEKTKTEQLSLGF